MGKRAPYPLARVLFRSHLFTLHSALFTLHSSLCTLHPFTPPSAENREILVDSFSNIEAGENLSYNKL